MSSNSPVFAYMHADRVWETVTKDVARCPRKMGEGEWMLTMGSPYISGS